MPTNAADQTHTLLQTYYQTGAEDALERLLAGLRPAVWQRLRDKRLPTEDLHDLCAETMQRLVAVLHRGRADATQRLNHAATYALTVADRVFDDHLRRIRPNWCRLKRRLLYLLDGKAGGNLFARWKHKFDWLGGLLVWRGRERRATPRYREFCAEPQTFVHSALSDRDAAQMPLPELLAYLFHWLDTPLPVDELTGHVAVLQQIEDTPLLSLEGMAQPDSPTYYLPPAPDDVAAAVLDSLSSGTFRAQLCGLLRGLPLRQRHALLLGMSRDELLLFGTASEIAAMLELPLTSFAALWPQLPLPDTPISERLAITPKQVSNLRKCARERIARHLARNND